jgi:glycosyltransferase involved in cell wall biosynthesis
MPRLGPEAPSADMKKVRFSIVIPTLRRGALLRMTLEGLLACDPGPDEVIVIDADPERSAQAIVEELASRAGSSRLRYLTSAPGLAQQRNLGIDEAKGDVIVFVDDDVQIPPDLLERLGAAYADEAVLGATGRVVEPEDPRIGNPRSVLRRCLPGGGREGQFTRYGYPRYLQTLDQSRDVEYMLGCLMSARHAAARQVRFDEGLGRYALAEDEDFSYRLSRLGRIRYVPEAVVHHRKIGYLSHDSRDFGRLVVKNRAYLFRKNFPQTALARTQFALFVAGLVAHRLLNRKWRGAQGLIEGAAAVMRARR